LMRARARVGGGGGGKPPPYFLSVSMMADKESSKETFVQSAIPFTKNKF